MKTGLTKRQKTTCIYFDEASKTVKIQTHNKQHCSGHDGESSEIQARRSRAGYGGLLPLRTVGLPRYAETALALPARSF